MIVNIGQDVRIVAEDGVCFTLQVRQTRKSGKHAGEEIWSNEGYYGKLEDAARGVLTKLVLTRKDEIASAEVLCRRLARFVGRIEEACTGAVSASVAARLDGEVGPEQLDALFAS